MEPLELETQYEGLHGDNSDDERSTLRRRQSENQGSDNSDDETAENSECDAEPPELMSFEAAVRTQGRRSERHSRDQGCWGCRFGITGGTECQNSALDGLVEFVAKYYGTMDPVQFAEQTAKYHKRHIRRPIEKAGGYCAEWTASQIYEHFSKHTMHPNVRDVQRLRTLRTLGKTLKNRLVKVTNDEFGQRREEIDGNAVRLYLAVCDRETALYRAKSGNPLFETQKK